VTLAGATPYVLDVYVLDVYVLDVYVLEVYAQMQPWQASWMTQAVS
jgi:hypothetical protein